MMAALKRGKLNRISVCFTFYSYMFRSTHSYFGLFDDPENFILRKENFRKTLKTFVSEK